MTESVDDKLLAKLQELADRHEEINREMIDPVVASDAMRSVALAKEAGKLRRLVEPYLQTRGIKDQLDDARALQQDASLDAEMRELAGEEIATLEQSYAEHLDDLKDKLVTNEDAAIGSIIVEIRAGTGGAEAALFARDLYQMYLRYCEAHRFKVEVIDQSGSEMGGLKEVVLNIKGAAVFTHLGYESGGHRVQRVPETESQGRVHTSAATVAVLPEPESIDIDINWDNDTEEFVSRAGGPGGQNVNKVSSAIRLVHIETGITVSMRDEKSQHKNRAKARRIMMARLYDHHRSAVDSVRAAARKSMIGSGDRSQRIRTYNFPQNRCTDHRIGLDLYSLDKLMQGDMNALIEALQTHDKQERLENL